VQFGHKEGEIKECQRIKGKNKEKSAQIFSVISFLD
jgi:hypothetical protein